MHGIACCILALLSSINYWKMHTNDVKSALTESSVLYFFTFLGH